MLESGETRAALRRAISLAVGNVRGADFDLAKRRFVAQTEREGPRALDFLGGAVVVIGVGVDAREPEQRVQRALLVVQVAGEVQPLLQERQRRLRLPERAQGIAAKYRYP